MTVAPVKRWRTAGSGPELQIVQTESRAAAVDDVVEHPRASGRRPVIG